ncbi:MAG: HlyC/CorC family transporter [Chlamydiae bacterium CG10_big_fil_rev_8_21_14_0_10_35_9]|nr:MAG: HlyC/CorC family transporter [Chlamydiae bacterium CG10_big_fil_rev_8_21_14_0_10_35_9]
MIEILVICVCILFNAFLAGSETAFIATKKSTLRALVQKKVKRAQLLLHLRENPEKTLSVIQIGITFFGALGSAFGGVLAKGSLTPWIKDTFHLDMPLAELIAILVVVSPITYVSVVVGELVPKTIALRRPSYFALKVSRFLQWMSYITYPIVMILEVSTKRVIAFLPKKHVSKEAVDESTVALDVISPPSQKYVLNIVKIESVTVSEILLSWENTVVVEEKQSQEEVESIALASGHTRIPVIRNTDIIGILNTKEFMVVNKMGKDWRSVIREAVFVQEDMPILSSLRLMQEKRTHLVIVLSKEKKKLGIVTLEEILEEIVGDIYDEDDDKAVRKLLTRKFQ